MAEDYAFKPLSTLGTWSASSSLPPTALSPRTSSSLLTSCVNPWMSELLVEERRSGWFYISIRTRMVTFVEFCGQSELRILQSCGKSDLLSAILIGFCPDSEERLSLIYLMYGRLKWFDRCQSRRSWSVELSIRLLLTMTTIIGKRSYTQMTNQKRQVKQVLLERQRACTVFGNPAPP